MKTIFITLYCLSDDVIEQIKDFDYWELTEEQNSLIDKLITDEKLKECYKQYGLCKIFKQPKTGFFYCQLCKSQYFQQNFKNWTSGNHDVDEFIQKAQLNAKEYYQVIEWIEYDKFEDVEYLAKGGFGTTFKAVWKDGPWKNHQDELERKGEAKVALKCLHNSQDITADFLKEVESNILVICTNYIVRCFGITKDPKINNFIMVMELKNGSLRQHLNNNFISLDWNRKLRSLFCIAVDPLKRPNANELRELILDLHMDIGVNKVNSVIYGQVKEADEVIFNSSITIIIY
ncbi:uncharacterized protein OCT59_004568 [Rhizophagus irregularis]|uniref:uncharacterized protein n=1 Tax=Rhizophagus irregularis TaxID=588596 RepID=UPI003325E37A|nr:hypothetical protein OCT59_004568 [Rhizophagus irregularis]